MGSIIPEELKIEAAKRVTDRDYFVVDVAEQLVVSVLHMTPNMLTQL